MNRLIPLLLSLLVGCSTPSTVLTPIDSGTADARDLDTAPFDGSMRDAALDAGLTDTAESDSEPEVDVPVVCPASSTVQAFHPADDERAFGRELAFSADGSTLAISTRHELLIYDRSGDDWSLVLRRSVLQTGPITRLHGGLDMDDAGDTVIWGATIDSDSSSVSSALVFEREAVSEEWRETALEASPETIPGSAGVSVSGDGSTLAVRGDRGGEVILRLFERSEVEGWTHAQSLVVPSFSSTLQSTIELSERGDRVAWHTSGQQWSAIHRKEASGEWVLEFELPNPGFLDVALDEAGERLVVRRSGGPDVIVVYDRVGTAWAETSRFPLAEPALLVPAHVAVSRSGDEIYVSNSTDCGVVVWSWTQVGSSWIEAPTRYLGVVDDPDPASRYPMRVAGDTIAVGVPDSFGGEGSAADAVGVYLLR